MNRLFGECSYCRNLVSTGRFITVGSEQNLGLNYDMRGAFEAAHLPVLWVCTSCYTQRLKSMVDREENEH